MRQKTLTEEIPETIEGLKFYIQGVEKELALAEKKRKHLSCVLNKAMEKRRKLEGAIF